MITQRRSLVVLALSVVLVGCGVVPEKADDSTRLGVPIGPTGSGPVADRASADDALAAEPDAPQPAGRAERPDGADAAGTAPVDAASSQGEGGITPDPLIWQMLWGVHFEDVESMTRHADVVVIGHVVGLGPDVVDGDRVIYRDLRVRVDEVLGGEVDSDHVMVRQPDRDPQSGHTIIVDDLPRFEVGDDLLVFLFGDPSSPAPLEPVNGQGAYRIVAGVLETTDRQDSFIRALEGTDVDSVADQVRAAD